MIGTMLAVAGPAVSVKAEHLFNVGPIGITNALFLGIISWVLTFWILFYAARSIKAKRYNKLSLAVLWIYEYLFDTAAEALGSAMLAKRLAPIAISMFFFIFVANTLEVLPIFGTITYHSVPLFRGLTADLNFTFALAVVTFGTAHWWAIMDRGFFGNLGRYFRNPFTDAMGTFEGFLELGGGVTVYRAQHAVVWQHLRRRGAAGSGGLYHIVRLSTGFATVYAI